MSLSLIKNDRVREKRIVPRFPLRTMSWKCDPISNHALEVKDISYSGMQVFTTNEIPHLVVGKEYNGVLCWKGEHLNVKGKLKWVKKQDRGVCFGLEFDRTNGLATEVRDFLHISTIGKRMKLINEETFSIETPGNLKYWLKSDGPGEIFFWQHRDGEFSKIQLMVLDKLIEWIDGEGLRTGSLVENRNIDTPLSQEEEILFDMDDQLDLDSLRLARQLIEELPGEIIPDSVMKFLQLKLGH